MVEGIVLLKVFIVAFFSKFLCREFRKRNCTFNDNLYQSLISEILNCFATSSKYARWSALVENDFTDELIAFDIESLQRELFLILWRHTSLYILQTHVWLLQKIWIELLGNLPRAEKTRHIYCIDVFMCTLLKYNQINNFLQLFYNFQNLLVWYFASGLSPTECIKL